jgi:hypothetical protein
MWWYSTYPQNPEILFQPPNSSYTPSGSNKLSVPSPHLPIPYSNPFFPSLPNDLDDWALPPSNFLTDLHPPPTP